MYFSHVLGKCYKTLVAEQMKFILIYRFIKLRYIWQHNNNTIMTITLIDKYNN